MSEFAPKFTRIVGPATATIGTGGSIKVYNIALGFGTDEPPGSATLVNFNTAAGIPIMILYFPSGKFITLGGNGFIADKGLQVQVPGDNVNVIIFHSNEGA